MNITTNYSNRVYGLDVLRAIAIILVVNSHGKILLKDLFGDKISWIGLMDGVELFFVLSGFLIGGILLKIIHNNNYKLSTKQVLNFWKRRWFRTLPNYYLFLIINIILLKFSLIDGTFKHFDYKYFLFLQNFTQPLIGFFWESWSLAVEEWFYIFLPLSLIIFLFIFPSKKGILFSIITLITLPLVYRIINSDISVDAFWWDVKFRKVILMRLDTIIYGVLAAYIKFYYKEFWQKISIPSFILGVIMVLSINYIPFKQNGFFIKTFYFNITTIGVMLILPLASSIKNFKTFFGKIVTHISLISYSMYLVNMLALSFVTSKYINISGLLGYLVYWMLVITFSTAVYYFFEKPLMNLRNKKI